LLDDFIKRILQLEEIISLQLAIERAKAIKLIQRKRKEGKKEKVRVDILGDVLRKEEEKKGKRRKRETRRKKKEQS